VRIGPERRAWGRAAQFISGETLDGKRKDSSFLKISSQKLLHMAFGMLRNWEPRMPDETDKSFCCFFSKKKNPSF
jgi:hypothetical protein